MTPPQTQHNRILILASPSAPCLAVADMVTASLVNKLQYKRLSLPQSVAHNGNLERRHHPTSERQICAEGNPHLLSFRQAKYNPASLILSITLYFCPNPSGVLGSRPQRADFKCLGKWA